MLIQESSGTAAGGSGASGSSDDDAASLRRQIAAVRAIQLTGAPATLLLDTWSVVSPDGSLPPQLTGKLQALRGEGMRVIILSREPVGLRDSLGTVPDAIVSSIDNVPVEAPVIAILAETRPLPPGTHAWYVGGECPGPPFRDCRHRGPTGTDEILGLLSAAIVQERAGIAFRAAGAGKPFPEKAPFAAGILPGIDAAVTGHPARVARSERVLRREAVHDLDGETDHAIAALFPPLLRCQAPNGAIAGAPPPGGQGQPDYWFFWQRDAGQVAIALAGLLRTQYPFRESARALLDGYVRFVGGLPNRPGVRLEDLGVSRFTMEGEPIRTYGSPQNDGPAHTVLALATVLGEDAFDAGKPYLEYLSRYPLGPCFDPWEFAVADVFFDLNLARRALRVGARLARHAGEHAAADRYRARADELQRELEAFLAPDEGYIRAGRNCLQPLFRPVSHLDISVIGSVLTAYDVADPVLNVDEPLVIGTLRALERMSAERWPVNIAWKGSGHAGMGMGRFPEDMNDGIGVSGGNPWTFATLWAAQFYLRTIERLRLTGASGAETAVPAELLERADGYLRFVLSHMPASALTEQIDGETGAPRGARQLAWAHAAAIDTLLLRRKVAAGSPRRQQSR